MSDGDRTRGPSLEPELQDEFVDAALTRERGVHPRLSLARVHIRIGQRFIPVWWLLPLASERVYGLPGRDPGEYAGG